MSASSTVDFAAPVAPEDRVRADFYALLARLFFAPPDQDLLRTMGDAPLLAGDAGDSPLTLAWQRLSAAASVMDAEAARDEYETLFGGMGQSAVTLFASFYAAASAPGAASGYLVELRADLAARGLALLGETGVPEDHCAALFETMRLLIVGGDDLPPSSREDERAFYSHFIAPFHSAWCTAIMQQAVANFYRAVAECSIAFLAIEDESMAMA